MSTHNTVGAPSAQSGWWNAHARTIALCAVVLSVLVASGYAVVVGDTMHYADEWEYLRLTESLAGGSGYEFEGQKTAYRPPGLPLLLTPIYLLTGGGILALQLVGIAALAASAGFAYLLGRRVHSPGAGALAAIGVGCYPLFLYTATTLYPQIPAMALLLGFIEASLRVADTESVVRWKWTLAAGLFGGFLVLTLPTFAFSIPPILVWMLLGR